MFDYLYFCYVKLHVFNPENDLALACFDANFIPPASARTMAEELSFLPSWWADMGDAVWVNDPKNAEHWHTRYAVLLPELQYVIRPGELSLEGVQPWGWSPLMVNRLVKAGVTPSILPQQKFLERYRNFSNRGEAFRMLTDIMHPHSKLAHWHGRLCGETRYCTSEEEVRHAVQDCGRTILKAPWSGSGKGLRFGFGRYESPLSGWCARILREQSSLFVEPLYNKRYDVALEFFSDGMGNVTYAGLSVFHTSQRGTYEGNRVASEEKNMKWLVQYIPEKLVKDLINYYEDILAERYGMEYKGYIGIDMMICRAENGLNDCLHPCVEMNFRRTMGWVAVQLARLLPPEAEGEFMIDFFKDSEELWRSHTQRMKENPLVLDSGKMIRGYLPLTPITPTTHFRASLEVR